ncbi:MAG: hypothetical protein C5B49_15000 [Bdellovibrio sp.]|nr:MAG: hypothetical protein C5B49_15000 [Bdellovibrio sp.]
MTPSVGGAAQVGASSTSADAAGMLFKPIDAFEYLCSQSYFTRGGFAAHAPIILDILFFHVYAYHCIVMHYDPANPYRLANMESSQKQRRI